MAGKIKGFSIIELLIVIVIISILMAVIYKPISQKIQAHKVEGEVKKLYGLLQEGRMTAFTQKKRLTFELSSNKACLKEGSSDYKCIDLEVPFSFTGTATSIDITDRGTFSKRTAIYYSGDVKVPTTDCMAISTTRIKLGVWDGSGCNVK